MEKYLYFVGKGTYVLIAIMCLAGSYFMFNLTTETNRIVFAEMYGERNGFLYAIGLTIAGVIGLALQRNLFRVFSVAVIFVSINLALIATSVKDTESKNSLYKDDPKYLSLKEEKKMYQDLAKSKDNNYSNALYTNMYIGARSYRLESERYSAKADSVQKEISKYENQKFTAGKNTLAVEKTFNNLLSLFGASVSGAWAANYFNFINAIIGDLGFFMCVAGFFNMIGMQQIIEGIRVELKQFIASSLNKKKPDDKKEEPKPKETKEDYQKLTSDSTRDQIISAYKSLKARHTTVKNVDVINFIKSKYGKTVDKGLVSRTLAKVRGK